MGAKSYLVTGGTGFIGGALVRRLVESGHAVRVLDNNSRGSASRLSDLAKEYELIEADIRDAEAVARATKGVDSVCHLAFVNGTEHFYNEPDFVLDVGVRGLISVLDACIKNSIEELVLASSSEVYQLPPVVPTDESAPMSIPDPLNPRYSYAAGKIITEIMGINYGRKHFKRVLIFRPHNVYGPEMGYEHVIPQFVLRMKSLCEQSNDLVKFPIQGSGKETRAFVFIDDFIDGLMLVLKEGEHMGIYNIGTMDEVSIESVAHAVAKCFNREIVIEPGAPAAGATTRRCPDIGKLRALGYSPKWDFEKGLGVTADWYTKHADQDSVPQVLRSGR